MTQSGQNSPSSFHEKLQLVWIWILRPLVWWWVKLAGGFVVADFLFIFSHTGSISPGSVEQDCLDVQQARKAC